MPRQTAANDVFQAEVFRAIAQQPRRQIIEILARRRQLAVGALVLALGLPQPAVSKHRGALQAAGIVSMSKQGQQRMYALNYDQLRPIYDWVKLFEQHWQHQLDRIAFRAQTQAEARALARLNNSQAISANPKDQKGSS